MDVNGYLIFIIIIHGRQAESQNASKLSDYRSHDELLNIFKQITRYQTMMKSEILFSVKEVMKKLIHEELTECINCTKVLNLENKVTALQGETDNSTSLNLSTFHGPKGDKGDVGSVGHRGPEGPKGELGTPGIPGKKGEKGDGGLRGIPGFPGFTGRDGEKGESGENGVKGENGLPGLKGEQGQKGPLGDRGSPGIRGEKGEKGNGGLRGRSGFSGLKGSKGRDGEKGESGENGLPGLKGEQGQKGIPGPFGDRAGIPGRNGAKGNKGASGRTGPRGFKGEKGDRGEHGLLGLKGKQGEKGNSGVSVCPAVAFYASKIVSEHVTGIVDFENVGFNQHGGYNPSTGKFTAPSSGTYVFSWTILTKQRESTASQLVHNGRIMAKAFSDAREAWRGMDDSASNTVPLGMEKGQEAYISTDPDWGTYVEGEGWSSFSGWKLGC